MAKSPETDSQELISFSVRSNGKYIDDTLEVTALYISQEAGKKDLATISLRYMDSFLESKEDTKRFDDFQLGHRIEIAFWAIIRKIKRCLREWSFNTN